MESTYAQVHDVQQGHRRALLRSGAAVAIAAALLALAALSLKPNAPAATGDTVGVAASAVASPPAPASGQALEYPGAIGHYTDQPAEQPPTF